MKKRFAGFLAVLVIAVTLALPASAMQGYTPDFEPTAEGAYIVNLDTNIVVYQKDSEKQLTAASLTKMMTMLLLLKNYQDQLDTATGEMTRAIDDILYGTGASLADIRPGESVTLRNLLYAMELPSGNEAAYIAAFFMGGTVENFVAMMNEEAKALGCTGTVFTDPCGLDTGNVTTARDAYLILRALIQYDAFVEIAGTSSYWMPANTQHPEPYIILSSNKMLTQGTTYYRSYTQGGKTGSLSEGWQNFASWHTQNGETYISVLLHSSADQEVDPRPALTETGTLMDWVFQTFTIQSALDTTRPITERPIRYSTETDTIMLYPADDMMTLLPADGGAALTEQTFSLPEYLTAPIEQGDVVGTVTLSINGEKLGTVDLIAGSTVARNQVLYTLTKVGEFFSGTYFKVVVILTMIVVAVYAFVWVCAILIEGNRGPKRRQ
ncbi:D-alanyl-D-alanine carboxypeptidase [Subdoligranulum sp. DSM 109015]|uniref:serine-type D-Ala-D-Ala carboxypeptidase n=1 Tax=Gemmiger gallinarum TaxID=2779354 RepID=A0ABR9QZF9_9FIRM|nr:serine hydrolase [Gemmiger gallinarum]MBE5036223.1 D-alanyl-D-alanine carboxypeptidase [Gemmiger gallinarum]